MTTSTLVKFWMKGEPIIPEPYPSVFALRALDVNLQFRRGPQILLLLLIFIAPFNIITISIVNLLGIRPPKLLMILAIRASVKKFMENDIHQKTIGIIESKLRYSDVKVITQR